MGKFYSKLLFLIPICIYLAALNPYIATATYDNTDYYEGIQHFIETGRYLIKEGYPTGWAPVLPWILSIPGQLGFSSMWWVKGGITLSAILSLIFLYRLFSLEKRSHSFLSLFLFASSPLALLLSTRILTEWSYVLFTIAFLITLHLLQQKRSFFYMALSTLFLIAALFTRYIGIALFAPLVLQGFSNWRQNRKEGRKELFILLTSVFLFFSWQLYIKFIIPSINETISFNYAQSLENFTQIHLISTLYHIVDQIFYIHLIENQVVHWVCYVLTAVPIIVGLKSLVQQKKLQNSDYYVFAYLAILIFYKYSVNRYIFPVAPFLYCYFIEGVKELWRLSNVENYLKYKKIENFLYLPLLACYFFVTIHLITLGNGKTYNGLNFFISRTPEQFYKGDAYNLYKASSFIKQDQIPGNIYTKIERFAEYQYIRIFSDHEISFSIDPTVQYILTQEKIQSEIPKEHMGRFDLVAQFDDYLVYRKN